MPGQPGHLPSGPGRAVASSVGLAWRAARVDLVRDPAQLDEFAGRASGDLVLVLVLEGRYTIESRRDRRWRPARYGPGSVAVNAPGRDSLFRWRSEGQPELRSLHARFPAPAVRRALDGAGAAHDDAGALDTLSLDDPYVTTSLRTLGAALRAGSSGLYADTVAESLLTHLVHTGVAGGARIGPDYGALGPVQLTRVLDHMHQRLGDEISLDDLAALVNISKFHFLRAFTRATGLTPHRYLTRLRLRRAAELLRTTGLSVQQVAAACGYLSASRFAAAFRRQYGLSPAAYRRAP
jgi:AraC family transcriptional regulator